MRHWIVVLRFAQTTRIDIVRGDDEQAAAADFVARCLMQPHPPDLPLISLDTCEVPAGKLRELADETPPVEWPPPAPSEPPTMPVVGLCAAVRAYLTALAGNADGAETKLAAFAEHHGVSIDFASNRGRA
jgi:hypothetical protein